MKEVPRSLVASADRQAEFIDEDFLVSLSKWCLYSFFDTQGVLMEFFYLVQVSTFWGNNPLPPTHIPLLLCSALCGDCPSHLGHLRNGAIPA